MIFENIVFNHIENNCKIEYKGKEIIFPYCYDDYRKFLYNLAERKYIYDTMAFEEYYNDYLFLNDKEENEENFSICYSIYYDVYSIISKKLEYLFGNEYQELVLELFS